jgi:thiol-disulfide isomerase/thioredoxin
MSVRDFGEIRSEAQAAELETVLKQKACDALLLVFADWCGHCQTYKPMWEDFAKLAGRTMHMAAVQDEQQKNVPSLEEAKLQGYPTVVLFRKGSPPETVSSEDMRNKEKMTELLLGKGLKNLVTEKTEADESNPIRFILKGGARLFGPPVSQLLRSMKSKPLFSVTPRKKHTRRNPRTRKAKRKGRQL